MTETEERVKFSIDITPALRRRIRLAAASRDMTLRELLIEMVEDGLAGWDGARFDSEERR